MDKKQKTIKQFYDVLQKYPLAYLVFGSVGRGYYQCGSDIDSLIVFEDKDIDLFLSNKFLKQLPFDFLPDNLIDNTDRNDLTEGKIDFLRIKGVFEGEDVEFQFFPFSTVEKVNKLNQTILTAGVKRIDNNYRISDAIQERQTVDFDGEIIFYKKRPRLVQGGQRIDFSEIATHYHDSRLICGISTKKFLSPKILIDKISLTDFLDNYILRQIISLLLDTQKIEMADYLILSTLFINSQYKFGIKEEELLFRRFNEQMQKG